MSARATEYAPHTPRTGSCRYNCLRGGGSRLPRGLGKCSALDCNPCTGKTVSFVVLHSHRPSKPRLRPNTRWLLPVVWQPVGTRTEGEQGEGAHSDPACTTGVLKAAVRREHVPSQRADVHLGAGHDLRQTKGELSRLGDAGGNIGLCTAAAAGTAGSEGLSSLAQPLRATCSSHMRLAWKLPPTTLSVLPPLSTF